MKTFIFILATIQLAAGLFPQRPITLRQTRRVYVHCAPTGNTEKPEVSSAELSTVSSDTATEAALDPKMTLEEIEALPTLDELVSSGQARIEVFKGTDVSERFHWSTRALNGEFDSQTNQAPEADTEAGGEGAIAAALLKFPAPVSLTAVGRVSDNEDFAGDVERRVEGVTGAEVTKVATKSRSGGKFVSVQIDFIAQKPEVPGLVQGEVGLVCGAKMVF